MNIYKKLNLNWYLVQKTVFFSLHIFLLLWMMYLLKNTGAFPIKKVTIHFIGMAIFGGSLIWICSLWGKYLHRKDLLKDQNNHV
jgi:hypothetical protein